MRRLAGRLPSAVLAARAILAAFVLAWLLGPSGLRSAVPIWLVFAIAAGLELHFFARALTGAPARRPDRGPQDVDRERYGYAREPQELLLVRDGGEELWIPYGGETGEKLEALTAEARARRELAGEEAAWQGAQEDLGADARPAAQERSYALFRLLGGLALIGALAALSWALEGRSGWGSLDAEARAAAEARFSAEASRIAGKPVTIRCDEAGSRVGVVQHADGVAEVGGELAYLTPERCHDLYRLAFDGDVTFSQTARAIAVLAHEAWHLRGVRDEGATECYALQSGVELGVRLGLSPDTARRMMSQRLAENQARTLATIEYVVPPGCRDGGPLDLDSVSGRFP